MEKYLYAAARDGDITSGIISATSHSDADKQALALALTYHDLNSSSDESDLDGFHCYPLSLALGNIGNGVQS